MKNPTSTRRNGLRAVIVALAMGLCTDAVAVPAYGGRIQFRQPDGTTVAVYLHGNERHHYYETCDGVLLQPNANGALCYATLSADGTLMASRLAAHDAAHRSAAERAFLQTTDQQALRASMTATAESVVSEPQSAMQPQRTEATGNVRKPGEIRKEFPTTGEVRGLVILAEFTDKKFSANGTKETYEQLLNAEGYQGEYATGSVRDYFQAQSGGLFKPQFDVVGPVQLPQKMKYYGESENVVALMTDACKAADELGVDFTQYDQDGDGTVDFVFVVFAGYGQSQGGPTESVWPCKIDMTYQSWESYDDLFLGLTACSCELHGNTGETIDGIGTICHEFSHIFGLPDIYDPQYGSSIGMLHYDVMDRGLYNDDTRTPCGYTAMDKYTVGWLEPTVLSQAGTYTLAPLSEANEAFFLLSPDNDNEYYTLENRQLTGWDKGLPGHGLVISHVYYDKGCWDRNTVNTKNAGFDHVTIIPADNDATLDTDETPGMEAGDTWPNAAMQATSFSRTSVPAGFWHSEGDFIDAITNIHEDSEGNIVFDYNPSATAIQAVKTSNVSVRLGLGYLRISNPDGQECTVMDADGRTVSRSTAADQLVNVASGIYLVKHDGQTTKVLVR